MDGQVLGTALGVGGVSGAGVWLLIRAMASRATVDRRIDRAQIDTVDRLEKLAQEADKRAMQADARAREAWKLLETERRQNTEMLEAERKQNADLRVKVEQLKGEIERLANKVETLTRQVRISDAYRGGNPHD